MSDSSPSTNNSFAPQTNPPIGVELLGRPRIKRARPQLSCTPCRQGKLKCNREHPVCDQCAKRSRHEACEYVPPPPRNKQAQNMRGRIRNLESLVVDLINQKQQEGNGDVAGIVPGVEYNEFTATKEAEELGPETFGQLRISNQGNETYVGAAHWSAVLKEIEEVKNSIEDDDTDEDLAEELDENAARSSMTFGMPRHITKAQLIQEMPSKEECDKLLPLWFNSSDPLLFIIHAPTFQEEYNQFWLDPSSASVMWIALLYSAMALGIILGPRNPGMNTHAAAYDRSSGSIYDAYGLNDHLSSSANRFQQLASSAMVLADVAKSQPYTLETLMIYGECEFLRRDDHHTKIWLMYGLSMRVAMRMGYHRDPSNFKSISPFQGEMRRRVWHVLNMMDTLISFAVGLPAVTRRIESDTRAPHNFYDADIHPTVKSLPKPRPMSEITPATYTVAKAKVVAVFSEAAELAQRITRPRYAIILELEKRLEEAHSQVPEGMRVRPIHDCITDAPTLIMGRYNIEMVYLKTKLVLHRNFVTAGQTDMRYADSRKVCVEAAEKILQHHKDIFHACQPGGQMNKVWWYMSSLQTYDFLLAAMIVCLELNHLQSMGGSSEKVSEMFAILQSTYDIWANHPNRFRDSIRGAGILKAMLKKCSSPGQPQTVLKDPVPNGFEKNISSLPKQLSPESLPEELPPQIWGIWPSANNMTMEVPDMASEIDWTLWDSTMMGQDHMFPPTDTWVGSNNTTMESWMGATSNVDHMIAHGFDGFTDLQEPLNIYRDSSAFVQAPPPPSMHS